MDNGAIYLKVLLPHRVYGEMMNVTRVVAETSDGFFGILPHRLDCVVTLVPGILSYEEGGIEKYIAVDEGILLKTGTTVTVCVRNAAGGVPLGKLHEIVEQQMKHVDDAEVNLKFVMARLESGFIRSFEKLKAL